MLKGINPSSNPTRTLGTVKIVLSFYGIQHEQTMHVIPNILTNVPLDGLLGNDFLSKSNAKIDYKTNIMR